MLKGKQIEMWQVTLFNRWLDRALFNLIKDGTMATCDFHKAIEDEAEVFMKSLDTVFVDSLHIIKGRLKKKSNKGVTIVKKTQIIAYCRELGIPFEEATKALLNNGIICKYSKNNKDYPYRFNRRV